LRNGAELSASANSHGEDGALGCSVGGEEFDHIVVVEGEAGGAEELRIGRLVKLPTHDAGFELYGAIAAG